MSTDEFIEFSNPAVLEKVTREVSSAVLLRTNGSIKVQKKNGRIEISTAMQAMEKESPFLLEYKLVAEYLSNDVGGAVDALFRVGYTEDILLVRHRRDYTLYAKLVY